MNPQIAQIEPRQIKPRQTKAAARNEMWRRRRAVIAEVREMPLWEDTDAVDVQTLGNAYNELRQKALHLARMVEKEIEMHQQRIAGWMKKGGRGE